MGSPYWTKRDGLPGFRQLRKRKSIRMHEAQPELPTTESTGLALPGELVPAGAERFIRVPCGALKTAGERSSSGLCGRRKSYKREKRLPARTALPVFQSF